MTSRKLLSNKAVNHLLNSFYATSGPKCQLCLSSGLDAVNKPASSASGAASKLARGYSGVSSNKQLVASTNKGAASLQSERLLGQASSLRFASSRAAGPKSAALGARNKRDASTQARQQVIDQHPLSNGLDSFRYSELEIIKCQSGELRTKPPVDKLVFGHAFTDHMFRVDWDHENGWSTPVISKVHNLDLHPGAKVLHYAIEAFEGVKAYRGQDGKIRLFRLDQNINRLLYSVRRLALPEFDPDELLKCIHKLVALEQDWIPETQGQRGQQLSSLYIRPTILGVEPSLGVANSNKAILYVLLSPVGSYFKTGFKPIALYADPDSVRAWPGGSGNAKLGSNYAPTITVQKQAEKLGLQQVLWLFGDDMKLTEVGTMNVFVSLRNEATGQIHLITPPLSDGLILPGITRASILELAQQWPDVVCEERYLTIGELRQLLDEGRVLEMFGSGTACIVCPISLIQLKDGSKLQIPYFDIMQPTSGEHDQLAITKRLLRAITDIQYGKVSHPWAQELEHH